MNRPARLRVDCPRCENRSVLALDDDRIIACPLCNNWCSLCLDGLPTFVPITRPYRGSLIAGMRPTIDEDTAGQAIGTYRYAPCGADKGLAVILRDRAAAADVVPWPVTTSVNGVFARICTYREA